MATLSVPTHVKRLHKILTPVAFLAGLMLVATSLPGGTLSPAAADDSAVLNHTHLDELKLGSSVFDDGEYVMASRGGFPGAFAYYGAPPEAQAAADPCRTKSVGPSRPPLPFRSQLKAGQ